MNFFEQKEGELWVEGVSVRELANQFGTPLYIYSAKTLERHFQAFDSAFAEIDHLICYSVKANSNTNLLRYLGTLGAGVDIVSGGELFRSLRADIPPKKIVYSGVGKTDREIEEALQAGILMFNVESVQELYRINGLAHKLGKVAPISLRINPDVDPKTHPYISTGLKKNKFGLDIELALETYRTAKDLTNVEPLGVDCHIGSQLTSLDPFLETLDRLLLFLNRLEGFGLSIRYLDLGGGLGIPYNEEEPPHPREFGQALTKALKGKKITLILEPGRVIVGNAGILVTKVLYTKKTPSKDFIIVDAAMNDLVRPSLYGAFHRIAEVVPRGRTSINVDVVGPICESTDFLAQDRDLPGMEAGEFLAVFSAGAYGFTMSSQYNSRPRAAEILVDGTHVHLARKRETYEDLIALERA